MILNLDPKSYSSLISLLGINSFFQSNRCRIELFEMLVTACKHGDVDDGWIGNLSGSGAFEVHNDGRHIILLHNGIKAGEIHS